MPPTDVCNIWRDPIPSDRCDYAHGCPREVVAVVALLATDEGESIDAVAERRPFCAKHLAVYAAFFHEHDTRYEVHPVSADDLCAIVEERGSRAWTDDYPTGFHPSDLPHHYVPEL